MRGEENEASLDRRLFLRQLGGGAVRAAAGVAGAVGSARRFGGQLTDEVQRDLLAPAPVHQRPPVGNAISGGVVPSFEWDTDRLVLVDQRRLPEQLAYVECRTGLDVVQAVRDRVIHGGPAISQLAAQGIALAAHAAGAVEPFARHAAVIGTATPLRYVRHHAVAVGRAVDRMMERYEAVRAATEDATLIADALRREADSIAGEALDDHRCLATAGAAAISDGARASGRSGRTLSLLTLGSTGALAGGRHGTALGVIDVLANEGTAVHVFIFETHPHVSGSRISAWELGRAGVSHTMVADAALGALFRQARPAAVLVGAETIAANGDAITDFGAYVTAVVAARHDVPVFVCAPLCSIDLDSPAASSIALPTDRPAVFLETGHVGVPAPESTALYPEWEALPAELIAGIVTEAGVLAAPFGGATALGPRA